jgi:aminoglycoside 6'-N-acetyltransferase
VAGLLFRSRLAADAIRPEDGTVPEVTLRRMTRDDFPLMSAWLREPLVATWWHDDPSPEALERQYGRDVDGLGHTRLRIAELEGEPVGFIQWYAFADEPEYVADLAPAIRVAARAYSMDYLVGSPEHRGRGVGASMIRAACTAAWAEGASELVVPVHAENVGSQRVLERAGFALVGPLDLEPDNPAMSRSHLVFRLMRPASGAPAARPR